MITICARASNPDEETLVEVNDEIDHHAESTPKVMSAYKDIAHCVKKLLYQAGNFSSREVSLVLILK